MKLDTITNQKSAKYILNPNDEFYTPNYAIYPLLPYLKSNSNIWCPFDTQESNFVKLLTKFGHAVHATHVTNDKDFFFEYPPSNTDYIISNPPYSIKTEVFERLFHLNIPFAMLVGVVGLFESQNRFSMFKNNDIEVMYFDKRVSYMKSYTEKKASLNPPFSSVYLCSKVLPKQIMFETIVKRQ